MTMLLAPLATALLVLLAGAAIGATAIGGVLVVPALTGVAGLPVGAAIAASSFGFLLTGLLGWRGAALAQGAARWWPLHVAALAGAASGALLVHQVAPAAVRLWVAVLAVGSGLYTLWAMRHAEPPPRALPGTAALLLVGAAVGCGSALSGTGGPVLLLPVLMLLGLPTLPSVLAAQAVQLPIALAATGTHALAGRLDWTLGAAVGAALLLGAWAGRRLARRVDARRLRRLTALALIATGVVYAST